MASSNHPTGINSSNVRQSTRQTRTNPSRLSKTAGRSSLMGQNSNLGTTSSSGGPQSNSMPNGLYPGITHFSDAIDALPREFRRHNSLLNEVDGKVWALEEQLPKLLSTASRMISNDGFENASLAYTPRTGTQSERSGSTTDVADRRRVFQNIRNTLNDLLGTIDEKNHVARNANIALKKDVARLDAVYPYVQHEVSDEARLGSLTHWAYVNKTAKASGPANNERPRREAAGANNQRTADADHAHHESKRETGTTRRQRRNQPENDGDELRAPSARKGKTGPKSRAAENQSHEQNMGGSTTKRRKVDHSHTGSASVAMERSVSAATNTPAGRAAAKDTAAPDATKKRTRGPNSNARKRTDTATSTTGPLSVAPSPAVTSLAASTKAPSPVPGTPRSQASRPQQQTHSQSNANRQRPSSSASARIPNPKKGTQEPKSTAIKGVADPKFEPIPGRGGIANGDSKPSSTVPSNPAEIELKREEATMLLPAVTNMNNQNTGSRREPSQSIEPANAAAGSTMTTTKSRSSKTSTPVGTTFAESQRSRTSRAGEGPSKRSQKKGPSAATARQVALTAAVEDGDESRGFEDEDDELELRYCYCNEVSFGEMVACDNTSCPREWFHLSCVGLTKPPSKSVIWYCNECKDMIKKGKSGNGK